MRGEKNFGVDFRGGDLLTLSSDKAVQVAEVREALEPLEPRRRFASRNRNRRDAATSPSAAELNTSDAINTRIAEAMPEAGFKAEGSERVGALVGGELARSSLIGARRSACSASLIYVTVPLRAVVRDRRDRGCAARRAHDRRHLRAAWAVSFAHDGRRGPDDRRLLDQRHHRRLRPHPRRTPARRTRHASSRS